MLEEDGAIRRENNENRYEPTLGHQLMSHVYHLQRTHQPARDLRDDDIAVK
jgi:hypothetical protein